MVEVNRIMAILRRTIGFLGLAAALALSPAVSQAEVVLINGTVSYTSLFGPLPARSVAAWGTQTAGGALNVPNEIHQNFSSMGTTNFSSGVVLTFMNTRVLTGFGPGQLAAGHQPGGLAAFRYGVGRSIGMSRYGQFRSGFTVSCHVPSCPDIMK